MVAMVAMAAYAAAPIKARYFDGRTGRPVAVDICLDDGVLHITAPGLARRLRPAELRITASLGQAPIRLTLPDAAQCELPNEPAARELLRQLGVRPQLAERMAGSAGRLAAVVLAFILSLLALYRWGIPLAIDLAIDHAPHAWELRLGRMVLHNLDSAGIFRPSQLDPAQQAAIRRDFAALAQGEAAPAYDLQFRRLGVPNAFALLGGSIVLGDEIVTLAASNRDGLLTVLGHELGHVAQRDPAKSLLRGTLLSALAVWYIGDVSGLAASATGGIAALRYTRAAEHAADLYALRLMRAQGRSTRPAAALLRRLSPWLDPAARPSGADKDGPLPADRPRFDLPEYLSTHPDIADRIELFESDAPPVAAGLNAAAATP